MEIHRSVFRLLLDWKCRFGHLGLKPNFSSNLLHKLLTGIFSVKPDLDFISLHPRYVWCFDPRIKQRGSLYLSALLEHEPQAIAIHMLSSASSLSKCPPVHKHTQSYWKIPWDSHVLHNHLLMWFMHKTDPAAAWCKRHFFSACPSILWELWSFLASAFLPILRGPHLILCWALPLCIFNPVGTELPWFSPQMALHTHTAPSKSFLPCLCTTRILWKINSSFP